MPADLKRAIGSEVVHVSTARGPQLRDAIEPEPWVQRIVINESGDVTVYVKDAASAIPAIMRLATAAGIELDRITYSQPNLDERNTAGASANNTARTRSTVSRPWPQPGLIKT